jgi:hypothetical protein
MTTCKTKFGTFSDERFHAYKGDGQVGAFMSLEFKPDVKACKTINDAHNWQIDLIQIVQEVPDPNAKGNQPPAAQGNAGYPERVAANGWAVDVDALAPWDEGYAKIAVARKEYLEKHVGENSDCAWQLNVDRLKATSAMKTAGKVLTSIDPRYAQQRVSSAIPPYVIYTGDKTNGNSLILEHAKDYKLTGGQQSVAMLRDNPSAPIGSAVLGMRFEVTALLEYGPGDSRAYQYLGSVSWAWQRPSGSSDAKLTALAVADANGVTPNYTGAVKHWNTLSFSDPASKAPTKTVRVMAIPAQ